MKKIKYIDLLLLSEEEVRTMPVLIEKHKSNLDYIKYKSGNIDATIIQHARFSYTSEKDGIKYKIIKGRNRKWNLHLSLFLSLRKQKPDVILVHSMIYAFQIIILRWIVGSGTKFIVQNHAEKPSTSNRKFIQKLAGKCIDAYLFVSKTQTTAWIDAGIIRNTSKIYEVMEGSTNFTLRDKYNSKTNLDFKDVTLFLWVGRLDLNKDPLTILKSFGLYVAQNKMARLIMIYGTAELEPEVRNFIYQNKLESSIQLSGRIEHAKLEQYYNAADYFILGSHYEGSGYALCEAMACGCVPIVTDIPSFRAMLNQGECGYLFEPGSSEELSEILMKLNENERERYQKKVIEKFKKDLSFEAIGTKISEIIIDLTQE